MRHLLVHELQDRLSAERQRTTALPTMVSASTFAPLASALEEHLAQAEHHVPRLEECFMPLGESSTAVRCKGMEGLLKEGASMPRKRATRSCATPAGSVPRNA